MSHLPSPLYELSVVAGLALVALGIISSGTFLEVWS